MATVHPHARIAAPTTDTTGLWDLRRHGPAGPGGHGSVLLLPGAVCTGAFFDDVVADPRVRDGDTRWITATPPGFGGQPIPDRFSLTVEAYAELTSDLAAGGRGDLGPLRALPRGVRPALRRRLLQRLQSL